MPAPNRSRTQGRLREGATKTVGGKRYKVKNGKWVQVSNARGTQPVTSSSNRSARQNRSNASVTRSGGPNRSGTQSRVTRDATRTSTSSARVTGNQRALPPGRRGGDLARTGERTRRRNITSNPDSNATRTGRVTRSTPQLTAGTSDTRRDSRRDGRTQTTRRDQARTRQQTAARGSRSSTVRTPSTGYRPRIGATTTRGSIVQTLAEQAAERLLKPAAAAIGYGGAAAIRRGLGMGEPRLDKDGQPIRRPPRPGVDAPGTQEGLKGIQGRNNYAGPGGDPSGSGRGQAQRRNTIGLVGLDGKPIRVPSKDSSSSSSRSNSSSRSSRSNSGSGGSGGRSGGSGRSTSRPRQSVGPVTDVDQRTTNQKAADRRRARAEETRRQTGGVKGGNQPKGRTSRLEKALKEARTRKYKRNK